MRSLRNFPYFLLAVAACVGFADQTPSTQPAAQTGAFEITFTDRSPLSSHEKLMTRLADKDIGPEYDLSKQQFVIYVPQTAPNQLLGIVLYMSNDGASQTPPTLRPILDKRHLIFIMAKKSNLSIGEETGLSIDGVFNLKRRYPIDDQRTFLMGTGWIEDVGLATPDIFAGDVWVWYTGYWRSFPVGGNLYFKPTGRPPSDDMLSLAKRRPHVFGFETDNYNDGIRSKIPGVMTDSGFQHMMTTVIPAGDVGYPNLNPQWFGQMLDMLESVTLTAKSRAATQPSSHASPASAAQAMLNMAQAYLSAGKPDLAQRTLESLIEKYPGEPLAERARAMLKQIQDQP